MKYLIDGYNVIFECGLHARVVNAASLAKARDRLLKTIESNLSPADVAKTTVVFDAEKIPLSGQQEEGRFNQIRILYSINYAEADELIEELIGAHAVPKSLTVVSSDHRIQKAALRRKAMITDSGPWFENLVDGRFISHGEKPTQQDQSASEPTNMPNPFPKNILDGIDGVDDLLE